MTSCLRPMTLLADNFSGSTRLPVTTLELDPVDILAFSAPSKRPYFSVLSQIVMQGNSQHFIA